MASNEVTALSIKMSIRLYRALIKQKNANIMMATYTQNYLRELRNKIHEFSGANGDDIEHLISTFNTFLPNKFS